MKLVRMPRRFEFCLILLLALSACDSSLPATSRAVEPKTSATRHDAHVTQEKSDTSAPTPAKGGTRLRANAETKAQDPQPDSEVLSLGVDHIGLAVRDLPASEAFFVDALGFRRVGADPNYPAAFINNGSITITLWQVENPKTAVAFDRRKNVGLHHLALRIPTLETLHALHKRLSTFDGVEIEFTPELSYGGPAMHMMLREPSGNRIELIHRPAK